MIPKIPWNIFLLRIQILRDTQFIPKNHESLLYIFPYLYVLRLGWYYFVLVYFSKHTVVSATDTTVDVHSRFLAVHMISTPTVVTRPSFKAQLQEVQKNSPKLKCIWFLQCSEDAIPDRTTCSVSYLFQSTALNYVLMLHTFSVCISRQLQ
jgi:hypothetical protein